MQLTKIYFCRPLDKRPICMYNVYNIKEGGITMLGLVLTAKQKKYRRMFSYQKRYSLRAVKICA